MASSIFDDGGNLVSAIQAVWTTTTVPVLKNLLVYESDTNRFKVGDGITLYANLPYIINNLASVSKPGLIQIATEAQILEGTSNSLAVTPAGLYNYLGSTLSISESNAETSRALTAEGSLYAAISAETNRAVTEEENLAAAISTESFRATGAENTLVVSLSSINNTLLQLQSSSSPFGSAASLASLGSLVNADSISLTQLINNTGSSLASGLSNEVSRAETAENNINYTLSVLNNNLLALELTSTSFGSAASLVALGELVSTNSISLTTAISNEASRAEYAENNLNNSIISERNRAISVENSIMNSLSSITSTTITILNGVVQSNSLALAAAISSEYARALTAEGSLAYEIGVETSRAETAEGSLSSAIVSETNRAISQETSLTNEFLSLSGTFLSFETLTNASILSLGNTVNSNNSILSGSISSISAALLAETTRAIAMETSLSIEIGALSSTTIAGLGSLVSANSAAIAGVIAAETSRATIAEGSLVVSISNETTRAMAAETSLSNQIDTINTSLSASILSTSLALSTFVTSEAVRAIGVENTLGVSITSEYLRALGAEQTLQTHINTLNDLLTTDSIALNLSISSETTRAIAAEGSIRNLITLETARALSAEGSLATSIGNETSRALTAEGSLSSELTSLNNAVIILESAATSFGSVGSLTALNSLVNANSAALEASITSEISRATAAEGSLSTTITAYGSLISTNASSLASFETLVNSSLSSIVDLNFGTTTGAILIRGTSGWNELAAGTTGTFLQGGSIPSYGTVTPNITLISSGGPTLGRVPGFIAGTNISFSGTSGQLTTLSANGLSITNGTITISNPSMLTVSGAGGVLTQGAPSPSLVPGQIVSGATGGALTLTLPLSPSFGNLLLFGTSWNLASTSIGTSGWTQISTYGNMIIYGKISNGSDGSFTISASGYSTGFLCEITGWDGSLANVISSLVTGTISVSGTTITSPTINSTGGHLVVGFYRTNGLSSQAVVGTGLPIASQSLGYGGVNETTIMLQPGPGTSMSLTYAGGSITSGTFVGIVINPTPGLTTATLTLQGGTTIASNGTILGSMTELNIIGGTTTLASGIATINTTPPRPGAALTEWPSGAIVQNGTIYPIFSAPLSGTINTLDYLISTGSFTTEIAINGTAVTGLGAINVNNTIKNTATATALNTFNSGDQVSSIITNAGGTPTGAILNINLTWSR